MIHIIDERNFIQHNVLSLPLFVDLSMADRKSGVCGSTEAETIYEGCRLALQIYNLGVIFPVPPFTGPIEKLIISLYELLMTHYQIIMMGKDFRANIKWLVKWAVMIGGIASQNAWNYRNQYIICYVLNSSLPLREFSGVQAGGAGESGMGGYGV
jgi:hypothetical protein